MPVRITGLDPVVVEDLVGRGEVVGVAMADDEEVDLLGRRNDRLDAR